MSEITEEEQPKRTTRTKLPWMSVIAKPQMSFRRPKIALSTLTSPKRYAAGFLVLTSLFLLAGGIYNLAETPLALGFTQAGYQPIFTSLNDQFLVESLSAIVFIGLGATGFYLIRYPTSQQQGADSRSATFILILGSTLTLIGLIATMIMLQIKLFGGL